MDKIKCAAIIVLGVGEKCAAEILKNMSPKEVKAIIEEINKIESISEEEIMRALNEFFVDSNMASGIDVSLKNQFKESIFSAIGNDTINSVLDGFDDEKSKWIESIKMQSAHTIVDLIMDEHPQIITMILIIIFNRVSSQKGAVIIKSLSKELQNDIFKRMTAMGPISHYTIDVLSNFFNDEFQNIDSTNLIRVDGVETMANIISLVDTETENDILSQLNDDTLMKEKIEDKIFPFERLVDLDKKSLQTLLSEVKNDDLTLALKGVDDNIKKEFFKSMSAKSADILKDDMQTLGPVKLSRVLDAQKDIIKMAKKLSLEEKIFLTRKNDPNIIF